MSLNNLKNNESPTFSPNNFGNNLGLTPVRVFSVILDNTHPKYTGEDSIGTIFYGKVSLNESSISLDNLNRAKPSFSFVKQYPLVNEIVLVFNSTTNNIYSDTKGDNVFRSTYYFPNLNVWNNSQHNALPLERDLKNQENSQEAGVGIQQNNVIKSNIKLGEYFVEKDTLKSLQPFEGDIIFEGRFGQGLRFGSSNPRGKNNWSENDSLGAPITVLSNGHNQASGDTILEDINNTDSLIVMTSEHNINNLEVASTNLQSLNTTFEQPSATQTLIDDTPTETIETTPPDETEEIEFIQATGSIEETITQESPPVTSSSEPFGDPIFDLLDEAVEEGVLEYDEESYNHDFEIAGPDEEDETIDLNEDPGGGATNEEGNEMTFDEDFELDYNKKTVNNTYWAAYNRETILKSKTNITLFNRNLKKVYIGNGIHRDKIDIKNNRGNRTIKYIYIHTTGGRINKTPAESGIYGHLQPAWYNSTKGTYPDYAPLAEVKYPVEKNGSKKWVQVVNKNTGAILYEDKYLRRGWRTGGYHWMVESNGKATRLYEDSTTCNGVSDTVNKYCIHLNWIGGQPAKGNSKGLNMTQDQALTLKTLITQYIKAYPDAVVLGHNQFSGKSKECPWFWVPAFAKGIGIEDKNISFDKSSVVKNKIMGSNDTTYFTAEEVKTVTYLDASKKVLELCGISWDEEYGK